MCDQLWMFGLSNIGDDHGDTPSCLGRIDYVSINNKVLRQIHKNSREIRAITTGRHSSERSSNGHDGTPHGNMTSNDTAATPYPGAIPPTPQNIVRQTNGCHGLSRYEWGNSHWDYRKAATGFELPKVCWLATACATRPNPREPSNSHGHSTCGNPWQDDVFFLKLRVKDNFWTSWFDLVRCWN